MILSQRHNKNLLGTIVEFGYAEYGSALEMLEAAKRTESSKSKIGYINHALDEYRHASLIFKVLQMQVDSGVGSFERSYIFSPQNVVSKGYVDKDGFLIEKLSNQKFIEFVYANEYLAKESFTSLSKRIKDIESLNVIDQIIEEEQTHSSESLTTLNEIMKDEGRHWGFAKSAHNKLFPNVNLDRAFKRELVKNKMRMFYFKNVDLLGRIFNPIINTIILLFGGIVNLLSDYETKENTNLMSLDSTSIL